MSDIKRAAQWLELGRDVIRKGCDWWLTPYFPRKDTFLVAGETHELNCDDLSAEDWEVVE